MRNEIFLDFAENPDLAELFSRKNEGDKCCLEVHFQINRTSTQGVHGTIEKIVSADYDSEPASEDKDEMMPTHDEPVMVNIMGQLHEENSAKASQTGPTTKTEAPAKSSAKYGVAAGRR